MGVSCPDELTLLRLLGLSWKFQKQHSVVCQVQWYAVIFFVGFYESLLSLLDVGCIFQVSTKSRHQLSESKPQQKPVKGPGKFLPNLHGDRGMWLLHVHTCTFQHSEPTPRRVGVGALLGHVSHVTQGSEMLPKRHRSMHRQTRSASGCCLWSVETSVPRCEAERCSNGRLCTSSGPIGTFWYAFWMPKVVYTWVSAKCSLKSKILETGYLSERVIAFRAR